MIGLAAEVRFVVVVARVGVVVARVVVVVARVVVARVVVVVARVVVVVARVVVLGSVVAVVGTVVLGLRVDGRYSRKKMQTKLKKRKLLKTVSGKTSVKMNHKTGSTWFNKNATERILESLW